MTQYRYEKDKEYVSGSDATEIIRIPSGGYRYRMVAEGYDTVEGRVDVIQGKTPLNVQMTLTVYNLSVVAVTGGSIRASAATATMGQTITLTPTAATGYHFSKWAVTKADGTTVAVDSNQFVMPASDITISAVFELTVYSISAASGLTGGSIKASASTAVMGTQITLTATPSTGYELASWQVTGPGGSVAVSNNKFTMPAGNVSVSAVFRLINYSIAVNQVEGGTISASVATAVMGTQVTLTAAAAAYYEFTSWQVVTSAGASVTVTGNKFTMPASNVTITAAFTRLARVVGFALDRNLMKTDPSGCITYVEEAAGLTPMSASGDGGWADAWPFNTIKPVVLKSDGSVYKYLNKANTNQYEDGSSATSELSSAAYDTFTEIPKLYYKVIVSGNVSTVYFSDAPGDGFKVHPAFVVDNAEKDKIYIGRYLAYLSSSKLYSRSGVTATASTTRPTFRSAAKARGTGFNLVSYHDWTLVNLLFVLGFKSLNGQSALGQGRVSASSYASNGGTNGQKWNYGTTGQSTMVSLFGIENWWGEKWWFIDNYVDDNGVIKAGQSSSPDDNATGYETIKTYGSNFSAYPGKIAGGEKDFFLGEESGGSSTAGLCDYQWIYADGKYLAFVGGGRSLSTPADGGPFCFNSNSVLSGSYTNVGSRLAYKP